MQKTYNIYCDESCHLENDKQKAMVIGAVWCRAAVREKMFNKIKEIKLKHKLSPDVEIKWNKVSMSKIDFYLELIQYFFKEKEIHFRALIVPDKSVLNHNDFNQTHDDFYYKMFFDMLKVIIWPDRYYNIYLDLKDTNGLEKIEKLKNVIENENYDFSKSIIQKIQEVRSEQVSLIQLADLLIGSLSYLHRNIETSQAKLILIDEIKKLSGYSLLKSTLPSAQKFNLFIWQPGYTRKRKNGSF